MQEAAMKRSGSSMVADLSHSQPKVASTGPSIQSVKWDNISDSAFDGAPDLRDLNLSFHAFTSLAALARLPELRELRAHNNAVSTLLGLQRCKKLERLLLQCNALVEVETAVVTEFKLLRVLRLDSNAITSIPPRALDKCFSLEELDLTSNRLSALPGFRLKKLTTLRAGRNGITAVSPDMGVGCPALTDLELNHNALTSSALASVGLANFTLLTSLNLNCNSIGPHVAAAFPVALPGLLELFLDENRLESLDGISDRFPALQVLHVAHNAIDSVAAGVGRRHGAAVAVALNWRTTLQALKALRLLELRVEGNAFMRGVGRDEALDGVRSVIPTLELLDDIALPTPAAAVGAVTEALDAGVGVTVRDGVTPNLMLRPGTASRSRGAVATSTGMDSSAIPVDAMLHRVLSEPELAEKALQARDMLAATRRSVAARIAAAGGPTAALPSRRVTATVVTEAVTPPRPATSAGRASAAASASAASGAVIRPGSSKGRALAQALEYSRLQSDADAAPPVETIDEDDYEADYAASPARADVATVLRPMSAAAMRPASARPGTRGRMSAVDEDAVAVAALPHSVPAARDSNPTVRPSSARPASARPASARIAADAAPVAGVSASGEVTRRPFVIQTAALRATKRAAADAGDAVKPPPAAKSDSDARAVPAEPLAKWSQHDLDAALASIGGGDFA